MKRMWLSLPLAMLVACGDGGSRPNGQAPGNPSDPNAPRTLTGTLRTDCLTDSGTALRPTDLSGYTVKALVPSAAGGYTEYPGSGLADGSFSIPSVPPGECFIQLSRAGANYTTHYWTNQSQVHLGGYSQGRSDWTAAPAGTVLEIQATVPPAAGAYGEIIAPSLGLQRQAYFSTSINAWRFTLAGGALPESGKDAGYFSFMTPLVSTGGGSVQTIAGTLSLPASGLQPGATTQLLTAPQGLTPNAYQSFAIDAGAFHSAASGVATADAFLDTTLTLKVQPHGSTVAPLAAATLLVFQSPATSGVLQQWDLPYANPYPSTWGGVVTVKRTFLKDYVLPGSTTTAKWGFSVQVTYPKNNLPSQPIAPLVGPVRNVKMNGQAMSKPTLSVGTIPLLTWDAPTVGTPTMYMLSLYQVSSAPGSNSVSSTAIAHFRTTKNRLEIPPGLLVAGNAYFGILSAAYQGQFDPSHPNRTGFPMAYADYSTELFIP